MHQTDAEAQLLVGALEASGIAVSFTDAQANIVWVNPAFTRITGYSFQEIRGKSPAMLRSDRQDEEFYARMWQTVSQGGVWHGDVVRRRKDGSLYVADLTVCPVVHGDGNITGYIDYHNDVTEERLATGSPEAREQLVALGMVAAGVAHEINNPLASVSANVELALEQVESVEVRQLLREALSGVDQIRAIVGRLGPLGRRASQSPARELDVHAVIDSALELAGNEIRHRARVERRYGDVARVRGDETRLIQVFLNLFTNAAHAMPIEGAGEASIVVTTRTEGGWVVVEVKDLGAGMSEETRLRIFEPFFSTKSSGLPGLGLSVCRRLLQEMGGNIEAESELGRGSLFRVRLPAVVEAKAERAERRRARVLLVDDDPLLLTAIRRMLARDHDVTATPSALEARDRMLAGESFDVVLCDVMMPEMPGTELHRSIASVRPELAERFVFLTGGVFVPEVSALLDGLANRRMQKPFSLDALRRVVEETMR